MTDAQHSIATPFCDRLRQIGEWNPWVTIADQVQKAVDCYNAGAIVVHVREADGKDSKRMSMFNEMLARLRDA